MIQLRDYQLRVFDETRALVAAGQRSVLIQLPTGAGKTAIGAHILKRAVEKGAHTHFWIHRRELARQSVLAMDKDGVPCGLIAAGFPSNYNAPVQICSIQSLGRRVATVKPPDLIIVDECHHAVSASYSRLLAHYPNAIVLGLSASPSRLDGAGLNKWFSSMVLGPSVRTLTDQGWLSPYRLFTPSRVDLSKVGTQMGDYNKKELDVAMRTSKVAGDALVHYQTHTPGKKGLLFAWSVESSQEMAAKFNAAGIAAAHVDGNTHEAERDRTMRDFANGTLKVLTNVDIVSEGFDVPAIDCLFLLRPTQSLVLYLQQVGRGLRPSPGKDVCWIFDHCSNSSRHGFPDDDRIWDLDGQKKRKKSESDGPLCRTCPKCHEVSRLSVRICPCGYKLVMEREVEIDENAVLTELDPATARRERLMEQGRADSLEKLIAYGRKKGMRYPNLWAAHVLRARKEKAAYKERERAAAVLQFLPAEPKAETSSGTWGDF